MAEGNVDAALHSARLLISACEGPSLARALTLLASLERARGNGGAAESALSEALAIEGLGTLKSAHLTDPLERNREPLPVKGNSITVPIRARGLTTVRLILQ